MYLVHKRLHFDHILQNELFDFLIYKIQIFMLNILLKRFSLTKYYVVYNQITVYIFKY